MTLNQRQIKDLKKEVLEHSAVTVGFFEGILDAIPSYALLDAIRDIGSNGWITAGLTDGELQNMLVTESIQSMNYQDFKKVAPYLFSYPVEQREAFFAVQPIEVSRDTYDWLREQASELLSLKNDIKQAADSLDQKINELETDRLPNGDQVIGVDHEARELLLLRTPGTSYIDDWQMTRDGLLYDYRSNDNYATQALRALGEAYPDVRHYLEELVLNRDRLGDEVLYDSHLLPDGIDPTDHEFKNHREFYELASQADSFRAPYPSYEAYITSTYDRHYPTDYGIDFWGMYLISQHKDGINELLLAHDKALVTYTALDEENNYRHDLAYLMDLETETRADVENYLEHHVGLI